MNSALSGYLRVLRVKWRWCAWGVLLAVAAAMLVLIMLPPVHQSNATVFVRTPGDVSRESDGGDAYARGRAKTYAALANSTSVSARVISDLKLDLDPEILAGRIRATNPPGTALINISVSSPSAGEAHRTAGVFLEEYAAMVHTLESVPGSLVPRAELVVVDPPGKPTRLIAWGLPVPIVLLAAAFIGLIAGATAAVLRFVTTSPSHQRLQAGKVTDTKSPVAAAADAADDDNAIRPGPGKGFRRAWGALTRSEG